MDLSDFLILVRWNPVFIFPCATMIDDRDMSRLSVISGFGFIVTRHLMPPLFLQERISVISTQDVHYWFLNRYIPIVLS